MNLSSSGREERFACECQARGNHSPRCKGAAPPVLQRPCNRVASAQQPLLRAAGQRHAPSGPPAAPPTPAAHTVCCSALFECMHSSKSALHSFDSRSARVILISALVAKL